MIRSLTQRWTRECPLAEAGAGQEGGLLVTRCWRKEDEMAATRSNSDDMVWKIVRNKFGYTDEEISELKNPCSGRPPLD